MEQKECQQLEETTETINVEECANTIAPSTNNINNEDRSRTSTDNGQETKNSEEENVFQKPKRQKTSKVWSEFDEIVLPDGKKKVQCIHCKSKLAICESGVTSHYGRHLRSCLKRKANEANQQLINFQPERSNVDLQLAGTELTKLSTLGPQSKYDHGRMREAVAHWVLMHEHSFSVVEEEGYNFMQKICNSLFEKISRAALKSDCTKVYEIQKKKLKSLIKSVNKISLTTDMWKSSAQKIEYMVITGHFIDQSWKLQKRVLSFVHIPPPRRGIDIADGIYRCLKEWGIENKVYTISVDNAAYNDVALRTLKDTFSRVKKLPCGGKLFHVRCCAHILNLLVQDGISEIAHIIENVRESVKFVNQSEGRLIVFSEIVHQLQLPHRKLILDCPTRWNSTFEMLYTAIKFKDVFSRFKDRETLYNYLPSEEDWQKVQYVCEVLEVFNTVTNIVSGSEYHTSNLYLSEVFRIKDTLNRKALSENDFIREMVKKMKVKFDKYWGECNLLMSLASVLDPRCKMRLIEFCFPIIYPENEVRRNIDKVRDALYEIYNEYLDIHNASASNASGRMDTAQNSTDSSQSSSSSQQSGWSMFGQFIRSVETMQPLKSDLDIYLDEGVYIPSQEAMSSFDALEWWKVNNLKYRILSNMAADILAIPISTVASEATFSAGSRIIESYRASLSPETVQTLICGGDWIRHLHGVKKKLKKEKKAIIIDLPKL